MKPKKERNELLDEIKKNADKAFKTGKEYSKMASEKIDESAKIGYERAKTNPRLNELKLKASQAAKSGIEKGKEVQEKSPSILRRAAQRFLSAIERFIGAIRRGTQYGKASLEMLEQFAKLKELGIITDEEFEAKKKEILDRI